MCHCSCGNRVFIPVSLRFLGRLDTWNASFLDVDQLRYEISEYNIDLTIFEQFGSTDGLEALQQMQQEHQHQQGNEGEEFVN